jgi:signal transduction histidine kinase
MTPPGRRHSDRLHGHWQNDDLLAEWEPRWRMSENARLWSPVVFSFLIQVPVAVVLWRNRDEPALANYPAWQLLLNVVIAVAGAVALIGARRFPGPVVAIVASLAGADLILGEQNQGPPFVALAFAIVGAVARGKKLWAWISVGSAWLVVLIVRGALDVEWQPWRIAATTLGILIVFGVGESVRARRERFEEARRKVAERKHSEVQAERVRIARELHDVLAHSLSQINVQAGVGLHLLDSHPEKASEALASIKETSKTALDEVRSVLGILRAEGGADPSAPLVPEPDLARLDGLAASVTSQGVRVELNNGLSASADSVPKPVQLAIYRIVQESLTNVARHAHATVAIVDVRDTEGDYVVSVSDDGHGTVPSGGGRGLVGMRERAELLGGHLDAGPGDVGFRVTATIPRREAS